MDHMSYARRSCEANCIYIWPFMAHVGALTSPICTHVSFALTSPSCYPGPRCAPELGNGPSEVVPDRHLHCPSPPPACPPQSTLPMVHTTGACWCSHADLCSQHGIPCPAASREGACVPHAVRLMHGMSCTPAEGAPHAMDALRACNAALHLTDGRSLARRRRGVTRTCLRGAGLKRTTWVLGEACDKGGTDVHAWVLGEACDKGGA